MVMHTTVAAGIVLVSLLSSLTDAIPVHASSKPAVIMADDKVECFSQSGCASGTGNQMTLEECCLGTEDVRYYRTSNDCNQCVAYGWVKTSQHMVERYEPYQLAVGYLKGSGPDITFRVVVQEGTTQDNADYTVSPQLVTIKANTAPSIIEVDTFLDGVALEHNEHFNLLLQVVGSPVQGFFRESLAVTITDTDVLKVSLASDDYRAMEASGSMTVVVKKNKRIASPLSLTITPMTVAQAMASSDYSYPTVPPNDNYRSPNRAQSDPLSVRDFNPQPITVKFLPDLDTPVNNLFVSVPIVDNDINEAPEEYFLVRLDLAGFRHSPIKITEPRTSLCRIVDDDPIRIGFMQPSYTISRPEYEEYYDDLVHIAIEDGKASEQIFHVIVEAVAASPPSIGIVGNEVIQSVLGNGRLKTLAMYGGMKREAVHLLLDPYHLPSETVAFELVISSEDEPFFLPPKKLHKSTFVVIEAKQ